MVHVTMLGPIGEAAGTRKTEASAATVGELIEVLSARYGPDFKKRVGAARIVVNGSPIQFGKGLKTTLGEGDKVAFLVPVGGG
jgi:molybdopterin converting factor small subunit